MSALPFLPSFDVYVAFNPTTGATLNTAYSKSLPSPGNSNAYWTNISAYLREFATHEGRQHFLDRVEAGTFTGTFFGSDGFFWNGAVNGTGQTIGPRFPIAVTGTWGGTTYRLFFGIIDSAKPKITDQLNADVIVQATDQLKQLSLRKVGSPAFWAQYTNSTSVEHYYSATTTQVAVITDAVGNGTTATYTGFNDFTTGQIVTIAGLTTTSGASLNLVNVAIGSATSTGFTVPSSVVGTSSGGGSAYESTMFDLVGASNALIKGTVSFPSSGAIIYINSGCIDLANGGSATTGQLSFSSFGTIGGIDLWILGADLAGSTELIQNIDCSVGGSGAGIILKVSQTGNLVLGTTASGTTVTAGKVNDGYWHHIGLVEDSSGDVQLYCDGTFYSLSAIGTVTGLSTVAAVTLGDPINGMYVDEICVSNNSNIGGSGLEVEVLNRYVAGSLLQLPIKSSGAAVSSGDRIAEILCLCGYGTVVAGAIQLNAAMYFINNGGAWSGYSSSNGFVNVQPWYWDAPVFDSFGLDLIYEVCETDVGSFYQKGDGTFAFHNQKFFGLWLWETITAASSTSTTMTFTCANSFAPGQSVAIQGMYPISYNDIYTVTTATSTQFTVTNNRNPGPGVSFGMAGCWQPNSYTPTTYHSWSDDDSTNYAYDGPSLDAPRDEADVWTSVGVTPQAGLEQIYENTFAEAQYGYNTLVKSGTVHDTLSHAMSTACYCAVLYRSPLQRVQGVTLLAQTEDGSNNLALINVNLDEVVHFQYTPPNSSSAGQIDRNMAVEAIDRTFKSEGGVFTAAYVLDPYVVRG